MAKYDFTKYRAITDAEKVSPRLEHDYRPIEDDKDIVVKVEYFKAGEKGTFVDINQDGAASFNMARIFAKKAISISGLVLTVTDDKTDKPKEITITEPRDLLQFPDEGVIHDIVQNTAHHLIGGDSLNENEEGN